MYKIKLTKIAADYIQKQDPESQRQIVGKIEQLKESLLKIGKPLKGNLKEYRSIRSIGQRYRFLYQIDKENIIVIVVAVGIRWEGDKKDIYELMKKYVRTGLLNND